MFDFGGFDLGAGSIPSVSNLVPSSSPSVATAAASSASTPWWQTLINDGLNGYKTVSTVDLASQQIKAGQQPSVLTGVTSAFASSGSLIVVVIVILLVVMLLRG